jgi:hypothetical protein
MPTLTTDLFLLEDLDDVAKTRELSERDLAALDATAEWIKAYVIEPHEDLGRAGPACPFVPVSLERNHILAGSRADQRPRRTRGCRADGSLQEAVAGRSTRER